jgi:hypothetical protein
MPGTHENLKKCCSEVVPKKRKRHIEMKHLQAYKLKKRAMERSRCSPMVPPTPSVLTPPQTQVADKLTSFGLSHTNEEINDIFSSIVETPLDATQPPEPHSTDAADTVIDSIVHQLSKGVESLPVISSFLPNQIPPIATTSNAFSAHLNTQTLTSTHDLPSPLAVFPPVLEPPTPPVHESSLPENSPKNQKKKRQYPTSKPFTCAQCGMSFNQRIHLKKHESKHTG